MKPEDVIYNALEQLTERSDTLDAIRKELDKYRRDLPHDPGGPTRAETDIEVIKRLGAAPPWRIGIDFGAGSDHSAYVVLDANGRIVRQGDITKVEKPPTPRDPSAVPLNSKGWPAAIAAWDPIRGCLVAKGEAHEGCIKSGYATISATDGRIYASPRLAEEIRESESAKPRWVDVHALDAALGLPTYFCDTRDCTTSIKGNCHAGVTSVLARVDKSDKCVWVRWSAEVKGDAMMVTYVAGSAKPEMTVTFRTGGRASYRTRWCRIELPPGTTQDGKVDVELVVSAASLVVVTNRRLEVSRIDPASEKFAGPR